MRQRLRSRITFANVVSLVALFVALGGGTAFAAFVVTSNSQVGPDTIAGHQASRPNHSNIISSSINGTDIASSALSGSDIQNESLTLLDIAGADVNKSVSISAFPAETCSDFNLNVPGAKVGDVVVWSFTGNLNLPPRLTVEPLKVFAADVVRGRVCNPTESFTPGVQGLGMRVITLR
jgi:hypothetical protein